MIEEATVDCYNEDEQVTGLFTMIEDNLALPFETTVLGMAVSVVSVDLLTAGRSWRSAPGRDATSDPDA